MKRPPVFVDTEAPTGVLTPPDQTERRFASAVAVLSGPEKDALFHFIAEWVRISNEQRYKLYADARMMR